MYKVGPDVAYPFILILYGIGTFISGNILRFPLLIAGGIACWVLSLISFYVSFEYQLLLIALAVLLSYIIPGHVLKSLYAPHSLVAVQPPPRPLIQGPFFV